MCGLMLNAWVTAESGALRLEQLERLDALTRAVPFTGRRLNEANLMLARLWESVGRADRAYAASRRTSVFLPAEVVYRTTRLEIMGRVAAAAGDTAAAVQAYRGYLALRRDAEPALADRVDRVRGELANLLREGQRP